MSRFFQRRSDKACFLFISKELLGERERERTDRRAHVGKIGRASSGQYCKSFWGTEISIFPKLRNIKKLFLLHAKQSFFSSKKYLKIVHVDDF